MYNIEYAVIVVTSWLLAAGVAAARGVWCVLCCVLAAGPPVQTENILNNVGKAKRVQTSKHPNTTSCTLPIPTAL